MEADSVRHPVSVLFGACHLRVDLTCRPHLAPSLAAPPALVLKVDKAVAEKRHIAEIVKDRTLHSDGI